jgi:tetratricopeptide (TPR) repeat protein
MAKSYKEMQEYELAHEYLMKSLSKEPEFIPALELTGEILLTQYKIERAIEVFEKIYEIDPTDGHLFDLARLYELQNPEKSIELYEQLIDKSQNPVYYKRLANLYKSEGKDDKYLNALRELYELSPDQTSVAVRLMLGYSQNHSYEKSWQFLKEVESYLPSSELVVCYVAFAEALMKDSSQAANNYIPGMLKEIDNKFFSHWRIHLMGGMLANKIDSVGAADKFFDHALSVADSIPDPPLHIGLNYYDHKHYKRGIEIFAKYEKIFPKNWRFPFFLSYGYLMLDSMSAALAPVRRVIRLDSANADAWSQLGTIYDELGMQDSSFYAYEKAIEINPDDALLNNNFAYALAEKGLQLGRALEMSSKAIAIDSTNAAYLDTYGWVQYRLGNYEKALEYTKKAIATQNASAEVFEHLGDIYIEMNMREKAIDAWQKSLGMEPDRKSAKEKIKKHK